MTRRLGLLLALPVTLVGPLVLCGGADAGTCTGAGWAAGGAVAVVVSCGGGDGDPPAPADQDASPAPPYDDYAWTSVCSTDPAVVGAGRDCAAAMTCPVPEERRWQRWGRRPSGAWLTLETRCFAGGPSQPGTPPVAPEAVSNGLREVPLPRLRVQVQPDRETLVNLATVFFTRPAPVNLALTVAGQPVQVVATPRTYRWLFGDGTEQTTSGPGQPYPGGTVVHVYSRARVTVRPRVDLTYAARFRVRGGPWQRVGAVTTVGVPTTLRVAEVTPLLTGER